LILKHGGKREIKLHIFNKINNFDTVHSMLHIIVKEVGRESVDCIYVVGCGNGDEPSGSIKYGGSLD
jgi:hypothetical protein